MERDDFGEDEAVVYNVDESMDHPSKRQRLICERQGCDAQKPLLMDRSEGYYVCTQCGTIANGAVFEEETLQYEGKYNAEKWRTFLKVNGLRFSSPAHFYFKKRLSVRQEAPANGTPVPTQLLKAQLLANRKYGGNKRSRTGAIISGLLLKLGLPEAYQVPIEEMVDVFIGHLERQRRSRIKVSPPSYAEFKSSIQEATACHDCKASPGADKQWTQRSGCGCRVCPRCDAKRVDLEQQRSTQMEKLHRLFARSLQKKPTRKLLLQENLESKEKALTKYFRTKMRTLHKCRMAMPVSEIDYKLQVDKRLARNESRTLVNAYISVSAACTYLCAQLYKRQFRWSEITDAVLAAHGRQMRRDTVSRWVGKIASTLGIDRLSNYEMVAGYANHYLDKLHPSRPEERGAVAIVAAAIMGKHTEEVEAEAGITPTSLRSVTGRIYSILLDAQLEQSKAQTESKATNLHRRQPWVLAAVCVYMVLEVLRQPKNRLTIAQLCKHLNVDQSSFQKCKAYVARIV